MTTYVYLDGVYWIYTQNNFETIKQRMKDSGIRSTDILIKDEKSDDYKYLKTNDTLIYDADANTLTKITPKH